MRYALLKGKTGKWRTWDLHVECPDGIDVYPLFMQNDEVNRAIEDLDNALLTIMSRHRNLAPETMGKRLVVFLIQYLPRTCHLIEWDDDLHSEFPT